jgi:hypothetical protein
MPLRGVQRISLAIALCSARQMPQSKRASSFAQAFYPHCGQVIFGFARALSMPN